MPVEDRLRHGLEANALAFTPEGEERLAQVRRRHRARTRALAATAAATVVLAVAAGSLLWRTDGTGSAQSTRPPTSMSASTDAYAGPRIPDSGWRKTVTRAQLVRAGADSAFLAENLRGASSLPITLSFVGEVYTQSARYPQAWAVGDAGTLSYDPEGRLVLTSTAPECRGCIASFTWRIDGNQLMLGDFRGSPDDPLARAMLAGQWTRLDP